MAKSNFGGLYDRADWMDCVFDMERTKMMSDDDDFNALVCILLLVIAGFLIVPNLGWKTYIAIILIIIAWR